EVRYEDGQRAAEPDAEPGVESTTRLPLGQHPNHNRDEHNARSPTADLTALLPPVFVVLGLAAWMGSLPRRGRGISAQREVEDASGRREDEADIGAAGGARPVHARLGARSGGSGGDVGAL